MQTAVSSTCTCGFSWPWLSVKHDGTHALPLSALGVQDHRLPQTWNYLREILGRLIAQVRKTLKAAVPHFKPPYCNTFWKHNVQPLTAKTHEIPFVKRPFGWSFVTKVSMLDQHSPVRTSQCCDCHQDMDAYAMAAVCRVLEGASVNVRQELV